MIAVWPESTFATKCSPWRRNKARQARPRHIQLEAMDAEAMSYPDGAFDCIAVPYVLSVTPDPERLVAEIRRVCRGGTILIVNHFSGSRFWRLSDGAVRAISERIGFRSDFAFDQHILGHDWEVSLRSQGQPVRLVTTGRPFAVPSMPRAPSLPVRRRPVCLVRGRCDIPFTVRRRVSLPAAAVLPHVRVVATVWLAVAALRILAGTLLDGESPSGCPPLFCRAR